MDSLTRRVAIATVVALAMWLALLSFTPSDIVLGQTTPRKPTVAPGQPSAPIAPPPPGVTTVASTPIPAPPVQPTSAPIATPTIGAAAPTPTLGALSSPTTGPGTASATPITLATNTPAAQISTASPQPSPTTGGGIATQTLGPLSAAMTPSTVAPSSAGAVGPSPATRVDGVTPSTDQNLGEVSPIIASAQVPENSSDSTASVITTVAGSPIRLNLIVPTRLDGASEVTVRETSAATMSRISATGVLLSRAFDIEIRGSDGRVIRIHDRPITLVVAIESSDVMMASGNRRRLRLARWDDGKGTAEILPTRVDEAAGTLTAETTRTSTFMIVVSDGGAAIGSIPWFAGPLPTHVIPSRMPRVGDASRVDRSASDRVRPGLGVAFSPLLLMLVVATIASRILAFGGKRPR